MAPEDDLDDISYAALIQAEVAADAVKRRQSDPALDALDHELLGAWRSIAPPGATGTEDELLIERLEALAHTNVDVPLGSQKAVGAGVKRVVRSGTAWYLRYVSDQVNAFHAVTVRFARRLDERVARLESHSGVELSQFAPAIQEVDSATIEVVARTIGSGDDVAIHFGAGRGGIVNALGSAGWRCRGIANDAAAVLDAVRDGIDVRSGDPLQVLHELDDSSAAIVVLSGFVEDLVLADLVVASADAARVVKPGGRVVIVVADPGLRTPVERDLRAGRGVAPATWAALMEAHDLSASIVASSSDRTPEVVVAERPE